MPDQARKAAVVFTRAIATVLLLVILGYAVLVGGVIPANADAKPPVVEQWIAKRALRAAIDRGIKGLSDPLPVNDSTLTRGVRLYGTHCAVCHGTSDAEPSSIAKGLYQRPPQFAKHDVTDDSVEVTYWKITHGIRLTGMPSYAETLTPEQRWSIAAFLRHQGELPPRADEAWKALPSAATRSEN
jgi:mono/diheme cytochrome c family protein